ncbi:MAG: hypothetical protein AAGE52_14315 [Myxococcota bacterium]
MKITEQSLRELRDFEAAGARVEEVVREAMKTRLGLIRFLARYAAWNGLFGSGVALLAAEIGRSQHLFHEEGFPTPLADRSVLVASYFFDAARDEFDDRDTEHRDTHRCLAQATIAGLVELSKDAHPELQSDEALTKFLHYPLWLQSLRYRVAAGYGGGNPDDHGGIFRAIGYHLGSELLADQEFSVIDRTLRGVDASLVETLKNKTITIAGQPHNCYQWIGIHSGHGGGAEADHFAWAVEGADLAFRFVPSDLHAELRRELNEGYLEFARDHDGFFDRVLE